MPKILTPPRMFSIISLLMIALMVVGTGMTQAPFFRQSIIDREAVIVHDMVSSLAMDHALSIYDLKYYSDQDARRRLNQSFNSLTNLSGVVRIKVFNQDNLIVWSDDPDLVGTKRTTHADRLTRALSGEVQAVFNEPPGATASPANIEFYVPISLRDGTITDLVGVLALYRDPQQLNTTIQHGLYLLWATIGGAGLLLFIALHKLFSLVYSRQRKAELRFSKLTIDHERIVQMEKLSAMGKLISEIAHQLNNPLVGVINLTQLAERETHNPERVAELLAEVLKAGNECRDIVQRILRINRISRSEPQATDMKELVRDTIAFSRQTLSRQNPVEFVAPDLEVMLNVDPVLIRHALFNLIHNAIVAAPEGCVTVELAIAVQEDVPGFALAVSDAGHGFSGSPTTLFEPFFTTRPDGTGLGLSIAQHIAMKHGGTIRAENLPAGGARFTLWLPAITTL